MSGRHVQSATGARVRIWLGGLAVALAAVLIAAFAGPASASSTTVAAQLSLSGLASADNPLGGSQIGVRPGDKVSFTAAGAPTAGLQKLGISSLVDGLLGSGATFQVTADFSKLPGGKKNTVLSGSTKKTFTFASKGTFSFTWTAQQVTVVPILGTKKVTPINLNGNQLASAGVKLNASNAYVGKIVAAKNPPQGGLSVQLPGVKVAPSAPVVGQLPTVSIPGVTVPTLGISVPDLNPASAASGSGGAKSGSGSGSGGTSSAPTYEPPGVTVPQEVVPGGSGGGGSSGGGSGGDGGFRLGVTGTGSTSQLALSGTGSSSSTGSTSSGQSGSDSSQPVDLASSSSSPSSQLPILLALLAVLTLSAVAGIYAKMYLLGRKSAPRADVAH